MDEQYFSKFKIESCRKGRDHDLAVNLKSGEPPGRPIV